MSGKQKEHRRHGILLGVADGVVFLISVALAVLLMLAYAAPRVDPHDSLWFAYLGLAAPFLYLANLVLMLYWTVRWKWIAVGLAAVAVIGLGHVSKFFRPAFGKAYEQVRLPGSFRVLSYNVEGFFGRDSLGKRENQVAEIARFIRESEPDIICMQEFELNRINPRVKFDSLREAWKYSAFFFTSGSPDQNGRGLAIYSKYPVVRRGGIHYPESNNASMWADVIMHRDTLRVYNNHMQSTQVNESDREYLSGTGLSADSLGDERLKDILRKLGRNFRVRAAQADSIAGIIHDGTPRVIVCGDFNDTPMSYTYRQLRGDLKDAFCEKGRGIIFTYRGLLGVFRIDYLFHSNDLATVGYDSEQPQWSDHNPVLVDLKLR